MSADSNSESSPSESSPRQWEGGATGAGNASDARLLRPHGAGILRDTIDVSSKSKETASATGSSSSEYTSMESDHQVRMSEDIDASGAYSDGDRSDESAVPIGDDAGVAPVATGRLLGNPVGSQALFGGVAELLVRLTADGDGQLESLRALEECARAAIAQCRIGGGDCVDVIHNYFELSPECSELFRILAKGAAKGKKVRDSGKIIALLRLFQALLACRIIPLLTEHSRNLGSKIIRKASHAFISALTSGKARLFAETLRVITAATALGFVQARECWKRFSPYMKHITRYLEVFKMDNKADRKVNRMERPSALDARSAVIEWGIALLHVADVPLLVEILGDSAFLPAAIKHLPSDPPELVEQLLQCILDKVLNSRDLPFPVRVGLMTAFNLEILAGLLRSFDRRQDAGSASVGKVPAVGDSAGVFTAAVRDKVASVLRVFACQVLSSATERAGVANVKLLLPLAVALRPADDKVQQDLLVDLLRKHPPLQSPYLAASPLPLSPSASHRFLTAAAVMAKLLSLVPGADDSGNLLEALHMLPPQQEADFQQAGAGQLLGCTERVSPQPPAIMTTVLADWVAPPQLCKLSLGPGLQHASYLVRLSTAHMLLLILVRLETSICALLDVAAALTPRVATGAGSEATVAASMTCSLWRDAAARLKSAVRARLPDFQVLVAARQHAARRAVAGDGRGGSAAAGQARLLLPRVLQVIGRYVGMYPESLAESRLDLPRLLADPAALFSQPVLLQTLVLLRAAPPRSGAWLAPAKGLSLSSRCAHQSLGRVPGKRDKADEVGDSLKGLVTGSYLGVLLVVVARARRSGIVRGSMTKLLGEAEALAINVLCECGLMSEDETAASQEARVWLEHVQSSGKRAAFLEALCLETGRRLHSLTLAAMAVGQREYQEVGGRSVLVLGKCPDHISAALIPWTRTVSPEAAGGEQGISALLVCAIEKLRKDENAWGGHGFLKDVLTSLFHRCARPDAMLRALFMVGDARDKLGMIGTMIAYFTKVLRCSSGGDRHGVTADETELAASLIDDGGGVGLLCLSRAIWGTGWKGAFLSLLVRPGRGRKKALPAERKRIMEKMLHVMPWEVLLAQAAMVGEGALSHGRVSVALHRGVAAAAREGSRALCACARQILLHLSSVLVAHTNSSEPVGALKQTCHELLYLFMSVLDCMWSRVVATKPALAREEWSVLIDTAEKLLAHPALCVPFLTSCAPESGEGSAGSGRLRARRAEIVMTVTYWMCKIIDYVLSRPWPGQAWIATSATTQIYCEAVVDAAAMRLAAIRLHQARLGLVRKRAVEAVATKQARSSLLAVSHGESPQGNDISMEGGVWVVLAALEMLQEHVRADKLRALVLEILQLDLHCNHTHLLIHGFANVALGFVVSRSRRGVIFACHRTMKQLLVSCSQVQHEVSYRQLGLCLHSLVHALLRSCVSPLICMPSPIREADIFTGRLQGGGSGAVTEIFMTESLIGHVANQDDLTVLMMDAQAEWIQGLLKDALCVKERRCGGKVKQDVMRSLCGQLARVVPSLRKHAVQFLLDLLRTPDCSMLHSSNGNKRRRGTGDATPIDDELVGSTDDENGEGCREGMLALGAEVLQGCRALAFGGPGFREVRSGLAPLVVDLMCSSGGKAGLGELRAAALVGVLLLEGTNREHDECGIADEDNCVFRVLIWEAIERWHLADATRGPEARERAGDGADGSSEERAREALRLTFLVDCIRWEVVESGDEDDTKMAVRVLIRCLRALRRWYALPLEPGVTAADGSIRGSFIAVAEYHGRKEALVSKSGRKCQGQYHDVGGGGRAESMPERECEAGEAAIEAVEKVVVRVCRSVLGGLVQAATGRELFSSAGKLVNDFFVDVVATRLMQASSAMAFQALVGLAASPDIVARGCNVLANSAIRLHRDLMRHPLLPAAIEPNTLTRRPLLLAAVACLQLGGPECCDADTLVTYLTAYRGTLGDADRVVRGALLILEAHNLSPKILDYAWGSAAQAKAASSRIIDTSASGAFSWLWAHTGVPAARMQHNVRAFPLSMRLPSAAEEDYSANLTRVFRVSTDSALSAQEGGGRLGVAMQLRGGAGTVNANGLSGLDGCCEGIEALMDPTYLLPAICGALASGSAQDLIMAIEGGALGYGVMAAASKDEGMRRLGYQVLELALQHVEEVQEKKSGIARDWTSLLLLLKSLRDSITCPLQRLPLPVAAFVAESVGVCTRTSHLLFSPVTKFLLARPFLDHSEVPMLYQLLSSGSPRCRAERWAIIRVLLNCSRSDDDLDLAPLRKRHLPSPTHVPSMLMATMDSVSADASTRRGILTVLHRLASSPSSAVYLVEHAGILSWLRLQFASDVVWQVPAKPDQAADPIPKTAIRLHDVADDQSLVTEGACGEGEAVAEVEIITELLLQLSWNLPAHRPDFALEEMILAVSQLLSQRTRSVAVEARGEGRWDAEASEGPRPQLYLVLDLVRSVLKRCSPRVDGRSIADGVPINVPCFLSLKRLSCLLSEVILLKAPICVAVLGQDSTGGGGAAGGSAEHGRSTWARELDAMFDIVVLTPVAWLTRGPQDGASAQHLNRLAEWMLQMSWPSVEVAAARKGGGQLVPKSPFCSLRGVGEAGSAEDILHACLGTWEQASAEETVAAARCQKVLRWLAALASTHVGFCDRLLRHGTTAPGLLRAALCLYRAPVSHTVRSALLEANNSFVAVVTARAALLTKQQSLQCLPAEYVSVVCSVLRGLSDGLAYPSDVSVPSVLPSRARQSAHSTEEGGEDRAEDRNEALALFLRYAWSGQSLAHLREDLARLAKDDWRCVVTNPLARTASVLLRFL